MKVKMQSSKEAAMKLNLNGAEVSAILKALLRKTLNESELKFMDSLVAELQKFETSFETETLIRSLQSK